MSIEYARIVAMPKEQSIYFVWRDPKDWEGEPPVLSVDHSFVGLRDRSEPLTGWTPVQKVEHAPEDREWVYVLIPPPEGVDWLVPGATVLLSVGFMPSEAPDSGYGEPVWRGALVLDVDPRDTPITDRLDRVADEINNEGQGVIRRLGNVSGSLDDLIGFPLITGTGPDASGGSSGAAAAGGQAIVDAEIRGVLGRKPSPDDVAGTLALMDRVMQKTTTDGVERWEVRPGGAYIVARDTGAGVTGSQASLAGLARDTLEQIKPLVEGVRQLAPTIDNPQLLEAARANFLTAATEAVEEAGVPGGPLGPKADVLLKQSLGELARFGVELGVLAKDAASKHVPTRANVVAPGDEEQYTSFVIVLDRWRQFDAAFRAYLGYAPYANQIFGDGPAANRDLGLRFTLLDRTVDVIAEAVDELDAALISVGIDRRERENIRVNPAKPGSATLAELMDWSQSFPEREARPLIQQGGVRGAALLPARLAALQDTVTQLRSRVDVALDGPNGDPLAHPRVKVAVKKLHRELGDAKDKADQAANV
jgi:hypothetical protein